ncbi:acetylglutamate synthase [Stemphylium lycopersici]|uniref:Amino-acid acetyltransferase, mitochondrial n=1 Tax=Stemphylium lycopersici TaxID=183478 RepID=A0A364N8R9_STELY|nr:acetylglutamate synthase [Stemphylium lycopersici]
MFIWSKAPARGLGKATKNLPKRDDRFRNPATSQHACLSTSTTYVRKSSSSAKERQRAERQQLTHLLKESPGKRDARNFLKQFDAPKKSKATIAAKAKQIASENIHNESGSQRTGVNLGGLYKPTVFTREPLPEEEYQAEQKDEPIHLALVKLRQPQTLDDRVLGDIAMTLSQMAQLGLSTAVVLDCDQDSGAFSTEVKSEYGNMVREQALRLVAALEDYNEPGALLVEDALGYTPSATDMPSTVQTSVGVQVQHNYLLFPPIDDGVIPVITPFAYDTNLKKIRVQADDVLLALIREFSGIAEQADSSDSHAATLHKTADPAEKPVLDRIIILDPLGGIPSKNRADGAHVFVNLEAEYGDIKQELQQLSLTNAQENDKTSSVTLGTGNPFSKFVEEEVAPLSGSETQLLGSSAPMRHLKNLEVVQRGLKLLPPSSSGLVLTPLEAARKAIPDDARTTPSKNPLLHNVLTDKPMTSSSLPTSPTSKFLGSAAPNPATFFKKGIPLTMIPDPRIHGPWQPPSASSPSIDLANDPRINFPKLVDLIDDSFRRKLHPKNYLDRIQGRVAGIIIAGDYEGGAICTWETPKALQGSKLPSTASPDSPYWVPYLDKFAVLTSSQGSGGVSDIVWAALTRTCFPGGVVWRSRTSNPVNKWYQERSKGMWNLPGGQWTMFWTTEGVERAWNKGDWVGMGGDMGKEMKRWDAMRDIFASFATVAASQVHHALPLPTEQAKEKGRREHSILQNKPRIATPNSYQQRHKNGTSALHSSSSSTAQHALPQPRRRNPIHKLHTLLNPNRHPFPPTPFLHTLHIKQPNNIILHRLALALALALVAPAPRRHQKRNAQHDPQRRRIHNRIPDLGPPSGQPRQHRLQMRDEAVERQRALQGWRHGHGVLVAEGVGEGWAAQGAHEAEVDACGEGVVLGLCCYEGVGRGCEGRVEGGWGGRRLWLWLWRRRHGCAGWGHWLGG